MTPNNCVGFDDLFHLNICYIRFSYIQQIGISLIPKSVRVIWNSILAIVLYLKDVVNQG